MQVLPYCNIQSNCVSLTSYRFWGSPREVLLTGWEEEHPLCFSLLMIFLYPSSMFLSSLSNSGSRCFDCFLYKSTIAALKVLMCEIENTSSSSSLSSSTLFNFSLLSASWQSLPKKAFIWGRGSGKIISSFSLMHSTAFVFKNATNCLTFDL